jgi:hypothetical protein
LERLHRRPNRPAAGQQLARRFGEAAAQRAESLEADCDLGAGVDEVVQNPATGCSGLPYTTASSGSMSRRDVKIGQGTTSPSPQIELMLDS